MTSLNSNPTSRKILSAARRLLSKHGSDSITMRRVAHAVGITPMAIYRHFPDRDALLNSLANEGFADLTSRLSRNNRDGTRPRAARSAAPLAAPEPEGRRRASPRNRAKNNLESRLAHLADIYLDHALARPRLFELMFLKPRAGARRFPRDFTAGQSPTANLMVQALRDAIAAKQFPRIPENEIWEIVFDMGALSHGLIMLYLGGRVAASPAHFRALYQRAFRRYLRGLRK
jgi:AcrR family transcriptional regulator